jgi:surface polysaccharide O-acyltransferase-like enzyme
MELLRVVAMSFVVLGHFNGYGFGYFGMKDASPSLYNVCSLSICESFMVVGVPLFILISGYYSIKLRIKAILNLYFICFFYSLVLTVLSGTFHSDVITIKSIAKIFIPFTSGGWWFIPVYFCLMLLSPLLNKAVENFTHKELILMLFLFFIVNCYFGYIRRIDSISGGMGTSLVNFMFIYFIGRVIRIFENKFNYHYWQPMLAYILLSFFNGCLIIFSYYKTNINHSIMIEYNNPLLILSAVCLFMFFKKISFKSLFVNWMGKSALAIYLLHIHEPIFSFIFPFNTNYINSIGFGGILMYIKLVFLFLFIIFGSILIDQVRIVFMNPILVSMNKAIDRFKNYIIN